MLLSIFNPIYNKIGNILNRLKNVHSTKYVYFVISVEGVGAARRADPEHEL